MSKWLFLDTGIYKYVSDLEDNIDWELGWDFVDNDNDPGVLWDTHGTQVASIIGAIPDNYIGIAGINSRVSIVPIRILNSVHDDGAWGKTTELLLGMEHAITMGVDIINLSVAIDVPYFSDIQAVNEMIEWAEDEGILIVAAAGNDGELSPTYPASHSMVLSVGAVGPTLQPASYTNRGVDLYAPGGDYYLYPAGKENTIKTIYSWAQGTSIASAHVAGVAALMKANNPTLSPSELRSRLKNTSLKLTYDDSTNPGLVDAFRAVTNTKHGRIFVFVGEENYYNFTYLTEESTYTYPKDGSQNYYQISSLPAGFHHVYAWIDSDADNTLSSGDWLGETEIYLDEGEVEEVNLNLVKVW